jgi:predicted nucleotidyltransferase
MILPNPAEQNLQILSQVAHALGPLRESLVFVGGCVTGLLVTDVRSQPIRATKDVDLVAQVSSKQDYYDLEKAFGKRGFVHDTSPDAPICRWKRGDVLVDLMPTAQGVLGFHNRWYGLAVETAQPFVLPDGTKISLVTAPAFLGTKIEAFRDRGKGDFLASHDLEDVITIIDGRETLIDEVRAAPVELRKYIGAELAVLLSNSDFIESVPGHLPPDLGSQRRAPRLMERMRALSELRVG